ncbi:membrane dipeptidase [Gordonia amicalis]|uniref:dipeptidase n=1 Tax=Gordonia amicalis TaxID=89053 RepID=UPI0022B502C6|nr:membrane dipeptidase [Gordonia amicalis]MCZ4581705.1 membrane dipeptidase [Gordonia amicalis]
MDDLLWDQHACLPLHTGADVAELSRFARTGPTFVSVNAGYSPHRFADTDRLLRHYRAAIDCHPHLLLATTAAHIPHSPPGTVTVAFDLEDCAPLDGDFANLTRVADLGVRTIAPTYNHANRAGGGCLDADDPGLTRWGRQLIAEMNTVGIVPDGSHCSARTGLDMCETSTTPVIYSHSCMRAVWDHPRNITDDQARACAATGGVVGITGVGIFLGPNTPTLEAMVRHLEYAVELVGIEHVGVSTDHSFDAADFLDEIRANPHLFDDSYTRWGPITWMAPETFLTLGDHLTQRGWAPADIAAVLHGNFLRVARETW